MELSEMGEAGRVGAREEAAPRRAAPETRKHEGDGAGARRACGAGGILDLTAQKAGKSCSARRRADDPASS